MIDLPLVENTNMADEGAPIKPGIFINEVSAIIEDANDTMVVNGDVVLSELQFDIEQ